MCGRYALYALPEELTAIVSSPAPELSKRYNIAPSQHSLVIRNEATRLAYAELQWGLLPSFAKSEQDAIRPINARSESVFDKPMFRKLIRGQRCLVPVSGFFEWEKTPEGKLPHYFYLRDSRAFALAGLWDRWKENNRILESFTILTTEANSLLNTYHDRMPVIIPPGRYNEWMDPKTLESQLRALLLPFPAETMAEHQVTKLMNKPSFSSEECIRPVF